ncbi:hypothetical protein [Cellulomonas palmilytica]|uniref:hypothetical protein n=1 Tax=Cellulomonas palmilytica TaxID=2608402 RepID=UPI001F3D73CA|nr:hypothetical protein [Cellulomonas palmilytica]
MPLTSTSDDHRGPEPGPPGVPRESGRVLLRRRATSRGTSPDTSTDAEFTAFMTEHRRDLLRAA